MSEITPTIYWAYTYNDHTLRIGNSALSGTNSGSFNGDRELGKMPWNDFLEEEGVIVDIVSKVAPLYITWWFVEYYAEESNVSEIKNLHNLDISNVTSLSAFLQDTKVTTIDLSTWDTSHITDMSNAFNRSSKLKTIYVSEKWNNSSVINSEHMFTNCYALVGAIPYGANKTNDVTYANYTTGYFTYKDIRPQLDIRFNAKTQSTYDALHPRTLSQYISYDNSKSGLSATNVYDAISELYQFPTEWITTATFPVRGDWISVCYGNGKFVAIPYVYDDDETNRTIYSTNGIGWTASTLPSSLNWTSVCYGNGKFVAVGLNSNKGAYSTDGITWTAMTLPSSVSWTSVCYGNGKFVAVASGTQVAYSTNGITWTASSTPKSRNWSSICYGNGKFVIATTQVSGINYSNDGITWKEATGKIPVNSICYGNGKFVAVGFRYAEYSVDGISWNKSTLIDPNNPYELDWTSVCYGNGKFVAVAGYSDDYEQANKVAYSLDGNTWYVSTLPHLVLWESVCYGNDKFVAVADAIRGSYALG